MDDQILAEFLDSEPTFSNPVPETPCRRTKTMHVVDLSEFATPKTHLMHEFMQTLSRDSHTWCCVLFSARVVLVNSRQPHLVRDLGSMGNHGPIFMAAEKRPTVLRGPCPR